VDKGCNIPGIGEEGEEKGCEKKKRGRESKGK
jgi:hypothetical protein